jgi:hypothetical protein
MKNKKNSINSLLVFLFFLSSIYSLFTYSLTDPNLIITSWKPYWNFQLWMWQTFFHNPQLLTLSFIGLISIFFAIYFIGFKKLKNIKLSVDKNFIFRLMIAFSPLLFSYNALSHDVFNYMFNAKMVTLFKADPHVKTALDFFYDDWTRFMHNTHTPAPYGYGWTIFSIFPYLLGMHKFIPSWFIFKALAWISYFLLFISLQSLSKNLSGKKLDIKMVWLIFANPLLVIEVLSNLHNDPWMLVPAIASLAMVAKKPSKNLIAKTIISLLLLAFSISTKMATIVLIPIWLYWFINWFISKNRLFDWLKKFDKFIPLLISVGLFLPLLTDRSKQFLPWYLTWSMVWLPFVKNRSWKLWVLAFSFSALLRYIPWLQTGGFDGSVILNQKQITWIGGISFFIVYQIISFLKTKTSRKHIL